MDSVVQLINKSLAEIGKRLGVVDSIKGVLERSVSGTDDGGNYRTPSYDANGHIEVALHGPLLPFGAVHVENLTPVFQADAVYGANLGQVQTTTSGSGTATSGDGMFVVTTGTTIYSQGVILSRKRLRYRPGEGVVGRFTSLYSTPVASSYQVVGFGHAEDGLFLGYVGTTFGLLYSHHGVREVQTLTVTTGATGAGNVTVTLNSTANTIALSGTGATAGERIQRTVIELATATYTGWDAYPTGATVVFVRKAAGTASGTYSFGAGGTGSAAAFAQTKAGVAATEEFVAQSSWNGDALDGTGPTGTTISEWTKLNVVQMGFQYLGAGALAVDLEVCPVDGNNATFATIHTFRFPGANTRPSFGNPSFPFTMAAYSAGSTTDLTVKAGSFAGFIEGAKVLHGGRFTYFNSLTTVGATNLQCLFTIYNARYYGGRTNQAVINLLSITGALKHTSPCIYYLIKNGTLAGYPNFSALSSLSCSVWDTTATTVTYSTGDQLLWTGHLGDTGELDHHFGNGQYNAEELTLQPGEWWTLAARAVTGSPAYVTGSINTREDQ